MVTRKNKKEKGSSRQSAEPGQERDVRSAKRRPQSSGSTGVLKGAALLSQGDTRAAHHHYQQHYQALEKRGRRRPCTHTHTHGVVTTKNLYKKF